MNMHQLREIYQFDVIGDPAPQGSKKFVGMAGGHGMMVESSKKVAPWRDAVADQAARIRANAPPLDGPMWVSMVFTLKKPQSAEKSYTTWPDRKPDVSKLARSTEDALVVSQIIRDDARFVGYVELEKCFPDEHPKALSTLGVSIAIYQPIEYLERMARKKKVIVLAPPQTVSLPKSKLAIPLTKEVARDPGKSDLARLAREVRNTPARKVPAPVVPKRKRR